MNATKILLYSNLGYRFKKKKNQFFQIKEIVSAGECREETLGISRGLAMGREVGKEGK